MKSLSRRSFAASAAVTLLLPAFAAAQDDAATPTPKIPPPPEVAQPAYSVLRLDVDGIGRAYKVWEEWVPQIVATPDGGGWIFFSAQARADEGYGPRRLFASHFDPTLETWQAAKALGTESTQFGPSAGVDSHGVVHLVYSERALQGDDTWSKLVYQRFSDATWSEPAPVAPDPNAGHQMLPSLSIGPDDIPHVVWRDQRLVDASLREALPINADLLASDLIEGAWTPPLVVSVRESDDLNPAWPRVAADSGRLVAIWSLYQGSTADEIKSAASVQWSTRAQDAGSEWDAPQTLFVREAGDAGGRLVDLIADPRGGVVAVFGLFNRGINELYQQRLEPGSATWSDPVLIATGDFGYLPTAVIAPDGVMYVVFNNGRNRDVDIGGLRVAADGSTAGAVTLTPSEGGVTARANITLDAEGVPWIVYLRQQIGATNVAEVQTVRGPNFDPPAS
ncbi:MAG: hypothetical protein QM692_16365 [Thermomicrobiales bacterium]